MKQAHTPTRKRLIWTLLICFSFICFTTAARDSTNSAAAGTEFPVAQFKYPSQPLKGYDADGLGLALNPSITIDSNMGVFLSEVGGEAVQSYWVSGFDLPVNDSILLEVNAPFTISREGSNSGFTNRLKLPTHDGYPDFQIWVKFKPTEAGEYALPITHSGGGAETKTLTVNGSSSITPLPVTLVSFQAKRVQQKVILEWTTASETGNSHFEVEVSRNPATGFTNAGRVDSKSGNSSVKSHYKFEYAAAKAPGTYYFLLKQVNVDGTHTYSKLVYVKVPLKPETFPTLAPNPIKEASRVFLTSAEAGKLNILITNVEGASVFSSSHALEVGENNIPLQLPNNIAAGLYFLTTECNGTYGRLKLLKE